MKDEVSVQQERIHVMCDYRHLLHGKMDLQVPAQKLTVQGQDETSAGKQRH